jgi:hypothetical protein
MHRPHSVSISETELVSQEPANAPDDQLTVKMLPAESSSMLLGLLVRAFCLTKTTDPTSYLSSHQSPSQGVRQIECGDDSRGSKNCIMRSIIFNLNSILYTLWDTGNGPTPAALVVLQIASHESFPSAVLVPTFVRSRECRTVDQELR